MNRLHRPITLTWTALQRGVREVTKRRTPSTDMESTPSEEPDTRKNSSGPVKIRRLQRKQRRLVNKGTGAGGANTNGTGLVFEAKTSISDDAEIRLQQQTYKIVRFPGFPHRELLATRQNQFGKTMETYANKNVHDAHGCKKPDEVFVDMASKNIFIIEKKFQQSGGSVCEKIQTPPFKIWQYERKYPGFKIHYIYCLSDWFKENCKAELEYLDTIKVPYFWGESSDYKEKLIKYIMSK